MKMATQSPSIPDVSTLFSGRGRGWLGNHVSNPVDSSLRFRRRARSDPFRNSLLLRLGFLTASITIIFLLAHCARALVTLRASGSNSRSLAEEPFFPPVGPCEGEGGVLVQFYDGNPDGTQEGDLGMGHSSGSPTLPLGGPTGGSLGVYVQIPGSPPSGSRMPFTFPGPEGPLLIVAPPEQKMLPGPFYGTPLGEPARPGGNSSPVSEGGNSVGTRASVHWPPSGSGTSSSNGGAEGLPPTGGAEHPTSAASPDVAGRTSVPPGPDSAPWLFPPQFPFLRPRSRFFPHILGDHPILGPLFDDDEGRGESAWPPVSKGSAFVPPGVQQAGDTSILPRPIASPHVPPPGPSAIRGPTPASNQAVRGPQKNPWGIGRVSHGASGHPTAPKGNNQNTPHEGQPSTSTQPSAHGWGPFGVSERGYIRSPIDGGNPPASTPQAGTNGDSGSLPVASPRDGHPGTHPVS